MNIHPPAIAPQNYHQNHPSQCVVAVLAMRRVVLVVILWRCNSGSRTAMRPVPHTDSLRWGLLVWGQLRGCFSEAKSPTGWLRHFDLLTYTDGLCLNFNIML